MEYFDSFNSNKNSYQTEHMETPKMVLHYHGGDNGATTIKQQTTTTTTATGNPYTNDINNSVSDLSTKLLNEAKTNLSSLYDQAVSSLTKTAQSGGAKSSKVPDFNVSLTEKPNYDDDYTKLHSGARQSQKHTHRPATSNMSKSKVNAFDVSLNDKTGGNCWMNQGDDDKKGGDDSDNDSDNDPNADDQASDSGSSVSTDSENDDLEGGCNDWDNSDKHQNTSFIGGAKNNPYITNLQVIVKQLKTMPEFTKLGLAHTQMTKLASIVLNDAKAKLSDPQNHVKMLSDGKDLLKTSASKYIAKAKEILALPPKERKPRKKKVKKVKEDV